MRRKYGPGDIAPAGYYLRSDTWEIVSVPRGEVLPKHKEAAYYRVPLPLVLVAGPIAGLIWFFVFPFLIPLMVGYVGLKKMLAAIAWAPKRVLGRSTNAYGYRLGWHK